LPKKIYLPLAILRLFLFISIAMKVALPAPGEITQVFHQSFIKNSCEISNIIPGAKYEGGKENEKDDGDYGTGVNDCRV
jgi:hypothetical protein